MALSCSDPASLLDAAKCFLCLNAKQHRAIRVYALAVLNGGSIDPAVLADSAKAFHDLSLKHWRGLRVHFLKELSGMPPGSSTRITDDGTVRITDTGDFRVVMP